MDSEKIPRPFRRIWWVTLLLVLLLLGLLSAGAWAYFQAQLDKIHFVESDDSLGDSAENDGEILGGMDYFNILLLGTDERTPGGSTKDFSEDFLTDARADACMLLSLDLKAHTAKLVSLERAIGVPIEGHGEDWLTHAFAYGGAKLMLKTVREQFDVDVRRYARVNVSAATQLIDAIGGVDLTLTETEAAALNGEIRTNAVTHTRVKPGLNHLDGFDALAYARQRFIDDDFQRVQRQRNVLQAALDQTKNLNLKQINHLLDVALPLVETNTTKREINALIPKAPAFLGVKLEQMTLPLHGMVGTKLTDDGRSMMMLDPEEAARILDEFLYGDFDPASYQASKEVINRVWAAQQKAAIEWAAAHPEPSSSEEESEEEIEEELVEDLGDRPRIKRSSSGDLIMEEAAEKPAKKKPVKKKPPLAQSSSQSSDSSKPVSASGAESSFDSKGVA